MNLLKIYIEYYHSIQYKSLINLGCYISSINIIFFCLSLRKKDSRFSKKIAYFFVNSVILSVLDLSWNLIWLLYESSFLYDHYKKDIYNIFLNSVYSIYPINFFSYKLTMFFSEFIWTFYCFVNFKLSRYNYKKQIVLVPEDDYISMNTRYRKEFNSQIFEGFKLRLGGRLSRKQRASSFWVTFGTMPLNTFSSHVEYAFYSLPLRNSEVTIRIWFNKGHDKSGLYLLTSLLHV